MKYTGWLLAFGLAATAGAAPLRVAVVPAQRTLAGMDRIDDATRLNICLSLHLQERLARTPGVLVLSEPWSRAVFTELNSRKWSHPAADFHARFSAQAPVDAVIDVTLEPGQLVCRLYDGGRNPRLSLPCPSNTPALRLAPAVAEFLARELKLDAAAASVLCAPEAADPAVFDAC